MRLSYLAIIHLLSSSVSFIPSLTNVARAIDFPPVTDAPASRAAPVSEGTLTDHPSVEEVVEARWAKANLEQLNAKMLGPGKDDARIRHYSGVFNRHTALYTEESISGIDYSRSKSQPECGRSQPTPEEIVRLVSSSAARHSVDVNFAIAVATAESQLDTLRNSAKGARGPKQLMPDTAQRYGVADICDPAQNIDAGMRLLRDLFDRFANPLLVAAAYNAGEQRILDYGGIPPFRETIDYVAEVLNIQLRLDGFDVSQDGSQTSDKSAGLPAVSGVLTETKPRQWVGGVMFF